MGLRTLLHVLLLGAAFMPDRCSAKFVSALILDEAVAEACSSGPQASRDAAGLSTGTKMCIDARLQRARYLRANGHLEASLKDFRAFEELLPGQLAETSAERQELEALRTAIAMQREGRRLFAAAEELEESKDRGGARMLYKQSIGSLKAAARYLIDLRSQKTDASAKSLTDLATAADRRAASLSGPSQLSSDSFETEF